MQFTAKQLNRQAAKASKEEQTEKAKLKKVSQLQLSGSTTYTNGTSTTPIQYSHRMLTVAPQAIQQNHPEIAKVYAQNAIRKKNENINLLRLGSRIDAVSSKVQTAVTMRQVTGSMANVVKGMDSAMKSMDLEKVRQRHNWVHERKTWDVLANSRVLDIRNHGPLRNAV